MEAFPAFFPLKGARVAVAGDGEGAEAKARLLANSPAQLMRLTGPAAMAPDSYAGVKLAFVAGADPAFRAAAAQAARTAGAVVNVVDDPDQSDFHTPAVIDRGSVVAAIGTAGAAPMLAALLRAELEAKISPSLGALAALLGERREMIRAAFPDISDRRAFLRGVLEGPPAAAAAAGDLAAADERLQAAIRAGVQSAGKIWLVDAPPSRDLLSLRAARALASIDVLAANDGVALDLLELVRRDASRRVLAEVDDAYLADLTAEGRQAALVASAKVLAGRAAALARLGVAHEVLAPAPAA
jgi:precorrin-2 dehydrogenase/sirohydrochlorin ferrochelatase